MIWSNLKGLLPGRILVCQLPVSSWTSSILAKGAVVAEAENTVEGHSDSGRVSGGISGVNTWAPWGISISWHHYPTHPGWRSTKARAGRRGEDTKTLTLRVKIGARINTMNMYASTNTAEWNSCKSDYTQHHLGMLSYTQSYTHMQAC